MILNLDFHGSLLHTSHKLPNRQRLSTLKLQHQQIPRVYLVHDDVVCLISPANPK